MVLLNGVKYACERCIRGHRVSSCTHTDKPLTMIKPKGRPASQCLHCRELRKLKNTHSSCSCGKKGKSSSQHSTSCLCHKTSHCTCPSKDKKDAKARRGNETNHLSDRIIKEEPVESLLTTKEDPDLMIQDVFFPFDTHQGLLDLFHDGEKSVLKGEGSNNGQNKVITDLEPGIRGSLTLDQLPNPPSDADLDLMENMFPLFPLVGANSFDDSRSLPLLPMPNLNHGTLQYNSDSQDEKVSSMKSQVYRPENREHIQNDNFSSVGRMESTTSYSTTNGQGLLAGSTHNPRPLRSSTSFNNGMLHSSARPKRPESVLSIASTSSNASRQNILEGSGHSSHGLPKLSSSAAFPPYHTDNGSNDDLQKTYFENSNFNDGVLLSLASDHEDFANRSRTFSTGATPQSSLPSRQPLQLRRKTSVSRSHSQLHQPHITVNKDNPLMTLKSTTSNDGINSFNELSSNFDDGKEIQIPLFGASQGWPGSHDPNTFTIGESPHLNELPNERF